MSVQGESNPEIVREGHYFSVLKKQARILGDYEQVHFRRKDGSSLAGGHTPSPLTPRASTPGSSPTPQYSRQAMPITPRRPSRPLYVDFNKSSAALFLRQTQSLWLHPDLARQAAAKALLDRPVGSFLVRDSQHARYALSVRAPDSDSDAAIRHFLIQHSQQNFLTIQGSNLPFLSIYDLLAYFCFHKSGGMPCCLKPPKPDVENSRLGGSESSESDSDSDDALPLKPPVLPPRTASMINNSLGLEELQSTSKPDMTDLSGTPHNQHGTAVRKKIPPPKPPRPEGISDDSCDEGEELRRLGDAETSMRGGVVIGEVRSRANEHLFNKLHSQTLSASRCAIPKPLLLQAHSRSSESISKIDYNSSRTGGESDKMETEPVSVASSLSSSPSSSSSSHPRVTSLIEMFESKSPGTSPKHFPLDWSVKRENSFSTPGGNEQKGSYATTESIKEECPLTPTMRLYVPTPPPKPKIVIPPVPPRPLSTDCVAKGVPLIPPRTPAPLLPPKPAWSMPPAIIPRNFNHRRSLSDSEPINMSPRRSSPVPVQPSRERHNVMSSGYERMPLPRNAVTKDSDGADVGRDRFSRSQSLAPVSSEVEGGTDENGKMASVTVTEVGVNTKEWQMVSPISAAGDGSGAGDGSRGEQQAEASKGGKWKAKPLGWAKKLQFRGKRIPRKRIRKYILELAGDQSQPFGKKVGLFITEMRARSMEPHQKMLLEVRNFVTDMQDFLLQHYQAELDSCGMENCDNSGHVVECALQECIVQPLSHFIYLRIEEHYATNSHLFQVQRSIHQGRLKTPEEMGIRPHLMLPSEKAISEITTMFERMMKTFCAISKLEYLLEVVRLTYENIKDAKQPKKPMNDLGADDFLPIFVWVLVRCGFTRAEIEAEYMWGLAHPNLFNGEGGYYLTTLTSAVNVLKELVVTPLQVPPISQQLPTMNNLQTELKVFFEDENTGQFSSAYYLPIVPTMTAAEICDIIVERRQIAEPEAHALFTVVDGLASILEDHVHPQEIKLEWTLQRTLGGSRTQTSSSQFFAYKLRTRVQDSSL